MAALEDRYVTIDAVRGFAVLGILLMNIVGMGLPSYAYIDPNYYGGADGVNFWTWAVNYALVDGKMRALFTLLFGASLLLVTDRAERSGERAASVHYWRMAWLLVFGLIHGWLIWYGDILYSYALVGMVAFVFRNRSPRTLLILGGFVMLAFAAKSLLLDAPHLEALHAAATAPDATRAAVEAWEAALGQHAPPPGFERLELEGYRGGFVEALKARAPMTFLLEGPIFVFAFFWDVLALMLVGMGLYKLGLFTGQAPTRVYLALIAFGYLVVLPLWGLMGRSLAASGFELAQIVRSDGVGAVARLFIALAHASVVILAAKAWPRSLAIVRLAAVGRMALTNYLAASLIATTLFYGYGFGLYGQLERHQLYFVVVGIWAVQLLWSKPWLDAFLYGPFEWLWRTLARRRVQPFRRGGPQAATA
ncbi:MAG: DUF418 domain-containing protein [Phenylobacterium sp.]|uniref:DUF418 domain-containing protein n=1 Tax=Phenylobacterium sp. TaxID=1871053 RepID=UPI00391B9B1F